MFNNYF